MTTKRTDTLEVAAEPGETETEAMARIATDPAVLAASTINACKGPCGEQDLQSLFDTLKAQVDAGNARSEEMLVAQAHTLDAIFNRLVHDAMSTGDMGLLEQRLRLALRAQSQCRATLEALTTLRRPPAVAGYVHQANVAFGPQQVNQGASAHVGATHDGNRNLESELLEEKAHGEWLDTRTASTTGQADQTMEAVGEIDRPEDA